MNVKQVIKTDQILKQIEIVLFIESIIGQIVLISRKGYMFAPVDLTGKVSWVMVAPLLSTILAVIILGLRERIKMAYASSALRKHGMHPDKDGGIEEDTSVP